MCKLRIKELARAQKITMEQVANAAGYRQATSLNQKMRRNGLTTDQLEAIATLFKVEVPDLFVRTKTTLICPRCGKVIKLKAEEI